MKKKLGVVIRHKVIHALSRRVSTMIFGLEHNKDGNAVEIQLPLNRNVFTETVNEFIFVPV